ncbi:penicillin-binding protein 2 [Chachezhania antarctica]|uniref:penicillin-binding protein 2 n=1 Tax=Chachezhania antarctica TaxID=2340860 RepID=UPI000EB5CAFB|nr:penicillin-binding protein 2 [Chachezhania antarctica]
MRRPPKELEGLNRITSRRALILGGAQAGLVGVLALRMRQLQVEEADQFRLLAEENRVNIRLIPPARGEIFDRNGVILARNAPSYRIVMVRENAGDVDQVIGRLSKLVELDEDKLNRAVEEMKRSPPFLPVTLADQVSWDVVSRVAVNAPALPGIVPEVGLTRFYPQAEDFAHVVGYVGPVSDYDLSKLEDPDPVLKIPRFQIGKMGVESRNEELLRGRAGTKRVEVNATGRVMRELSRREGEAGADLQLTIDADLQRYVQARLGQESASAVVMDVQNGDLRAIVSSPSYDPNLFVRGISVSDYKELTEDKFRPLLGKAVQHVYPPGSTFKMITAMAALEAGVISPEETVYCPGHLTVGGRRFHCWRRAGHGHVNLNGALKYSCDTYFYEVSLKVGIDKISEVARRFGLGQRHDVPLSAVAEGLTPTKTWKQQSYGRDWLIGDTVNTSIGQGYLLASPLQLAVMSARLATGREITPRLVKSVDGVETRSGDGPDLGMADRYLKMVRQGMYAVSNESRGTAFSNRIVADGMKMAGKTGTSQIRNISDAERRAGVIKNKDLPWERRDHALFVCFAPYDAPRYAVSVVVQHGGGGSTAAAPIARDVLLQALYGDTPPLAAYPPNDRRRIKAQQERLHREKLRRDSERSGRA